MTKNPQRTLLALVLAGAIALAGLVTNSKLRKKLASTTRPIRWPLRQPRPRLCRLELAVGDVRYRASSGGEC